MSKLNDIFKLLMSLHREYSAMLSEEEQMENDDWFDFVEEEVFAFKRKINLWLKNVEEDQKLCARSERSHSKRSFKKIVKSNMIKTSGSSSRSPGSKTRTLEENAKLAELEAEEAFLVRTQMADSEEEMLKIQQMVAKTRAKIKIFEESEVDNKFLHHNKQKFVVSSQDIHRTSTGISHHQRREPTMKHQSNVANNIQSKGQDFTEILCKLVKHKSAPYVDLDAVGGNLLEYHYFMMLFHEIVEKRVDNPRGKLTRLINYTKGDAKEMIKHCAQQPPAEALRNTKALLGRKYGSPYKIMTMYKKRNQGLATSQEWRC